MNMPQKHSNTERIGGPGASHENRKHPEKSQSRNPQPQDTKSERHSAISGGGGEQDSHHTHDPRGKGGNPSTKGDVQAVRDGREGAPATRESEFAVSQRGM